MISCIHFSHRMNSCCPVFFPAFRSQDMDSARIGRKYPLEAFACSEERFIMEITFLQKAERNGFVPLYKTDVIEKQYYDIPQDEPLKTRLLYFDLKKD